MIEVIILSGQGDSASGISSRENMVRLRLFLDLRARTSVGPVRCLDYGREVNMLPNGQWKPNSFTEEEHRRKITR